MADDTGGSASPEEKQVRIARIEAVLEAAWTEFRGQVEARADAGDVRAALRQLQDLVRKSPDLAQHERESLAILLEQRFGRMPSLDADVDETYEGLSDIRKLLGEKGDLRRLIMLAMATTYIATGTAHADTGAASIAAASTGTIAPIVAAQDAATTPTIGMVAKALPGLPSGKSDLFTRAIKFTEKWEGGKVDDPDDPGGRTNMGVTQTTYDAYHDQVGLGHSDVWDMTREESRDIYKANYWGAIHGDDLPERVALAMLDLAVNSGSGFAIKKLQESVGVTADGHLGAQTLKAVYAADPHALFISLNDSRETHYNDIIEKKPSQEKYRDGWMNRLNDLRLVGAGGDYETMLADWEAAIDLHPATGDPMAKAYGDDSAPSPDDIAAISVRVAELVKAEPEPSQIAQHAELLDIIARLANPRSPQPDLARKLLADLRRSRSFDRLHIAASDMAERGFLAPFSTRMKVQALIELDRFPEALSALRIARLSHGDDRTEMLEFAGLEGRVYKQLFSQSAEGGTIDRAALRAAILAYEKGWIHSEGRSAWHGANLLALLCRARAEGMADPRAGAIGDIAGKVKRAAERDKARGDIWADASLGEAELALGDYASATAAFIRYVDHPKVDAFALTGTHRQLRQIWLTSLSSPRLQLINDIVAVALGKDRRGRIDLEAGELSRIQATREKNDGDKGYEACFGARPAHWNWVKRMGFIAQAIGRIERRGPLPDPAGTGFVMDGKTLNTAWAAFGPVLITNEHVVSGYQPTALRPDETVVRFSEVDDQNTYAVGPMLWCSPRTDHDVTIFRLDRVPAGVTKLEELSPLSSLRTEAAGKFSGVTAIGHPGGADRLHLGIENLEVEDMEYERPAGEPERVWYKCPTTQGNSGSPVFTWSRLEATAVHHRAIPSRGCNEGVSLASIRDAIRQRPEGWHGPMTAS